MNFVNEVENHITNKLYSYVSNISNIYENDYTLDVFNKIKDNIKISIHIDKDVENSIINEYSHIKKCHDEKIRKFIDDIKEVGDVRNMKKYGITSNEFYDEVRSAFPVIEIIHVNSPHSIELKYLFNCKQMDDSIFYQHVLNKREFTRYRNLQTDIWFSILGGRIKLLQYMEKNIEKIEEEFTNDKLNLQTILNKKYFREKILANFNPIIPFGSCDNYMQLAINSNQRDVERFLTLIYKKNNIKCHENIKGAHYFDIHPNIITAQLAHIPASPVTTKCADLEFLF